MFGRCLFLEWIFIFAQNATRILHNMYTNKLLIFDKDRILVKSKTDPNGFILSPSDQAPVEGMQEQVKAFYAAGWRMVIASNQMDILLGYKHLMTAFQEFSYCINYLFPEISCAYFCPDEGQSCHSLKGNLQIVTKYVEADYKMCFRKPEPGMLWLAAAFSGFSPTENGFYGQDIVFVSDKESDKQAADKAKMAYWHRNWFLMKSPTYTSSSER